MANEPRLIQVTYCEHEHCARKATSYRQVLGGYRCDEHNPRVADPLAPTFSPARYAKGKIAVRCPSNGNGTKTRAMRLASALSSRWTNREKAYIMSPGAAAKLKAHYEAGHDAELGDVRGVLDWVLA